MSKLTSVLALALIAGAAHAGSSHDPPPEYLTNPGNIEIEWIWYPPAKAAKVCAWLTGEPHAIACALTNVSPCQVIAPLGASPYWHGIIVRHETAECYGWNHD